MASSSPESEADVIERWDLAGRWQLRGWRQNDWELGTSFARDEQGRPDLGPIEASLPGSVRGALLEHDLVPSPFTGTASRASEWIEHRHWSFSRDLPAEALELAPGERLLLRAEMLDYQGFVLVDSEKVAEFRGTHLPVEVDLSDRVRAGGASLTIVFTDVPDGIGQVGWTSRVRAWKPRFNYGWDWTPRIVQVGAVGSIRLERVAAARLASVRVGADYSADTGSASVSVTAETEGGLGHRLRVTVTGPDVHQVLESEAGVLELTVPLDGVRPWNVVAAGSGNSQPLYGVGVQLLDTEGAILDDVERRVGFREVRWQQTEGAPADAEPWICVVNGEPVFLQGVNWVPPRPDFADVPDASYREYIETYVGLGVNVLRVWGGASLERSAFYDACDELGLLVWQELPLSSSGIDNAPPADAEFAAELAEIATSYAERRAHHASLVLWGGGNELTDMSQPAVPEKPLGYGHPTIAAARDAFAAADPGRRFVATSPTGPRVFADPAEYGMGVHHDVHGPWETVGAAADWQAYWAGDDALLRSEVGVGGASGLDLLQAFGLDGDLADKPTLRALWNHSSSWWLADFDAWEGEGGLAAFVEHSQRRQGALLAYAARSAKTRFPRCGGFIVWLGHDTFPCAVSLSLLDFWGRPKPAAQALAAVFRGGVPQ